MENRLFLFSTALGQIQVLLVVELRFKSLWLQNEVTICLLAVILSPHSSQRWRSSAFLVMWPSPTTSQQLRSSPSNPPCTSSLSILLSLDPDVKSLYDQVRPLVYFFFHKINCAISHNLIIKVKYSIFIPLGLLTVDGKQRVQP